MTIHFTYPHLKKFITVYLSNPDSELKKLEKSQKYIREFRNKSFDNFNLEKSRILQLSVLLYRFKEELEVGEMFWKITRTMILAILTNSPNTESAIDNYLKYFDLWKNNDLDKLVVEVASVYFNIAETKKAFGADNSDNSNNSNNEEIIHIDKTLENITTQCEKLNIMNKVSEAVNEIEMAKANLIVPIVIKAYWDKIEDDIQNDNYETIISNLIELKQNMKLILPKSEFNKPNYLLDECIDIDFFKQMMTHKVFDKTNIRSLLTIVIIFLKEWDSAEFVQLYDTKQIEIMKLIETETFPRAFRIVLEYITDLVSNFILRIGAWKKLLSESSETI